LSFYRRTLC